MAEDPRTLARSALITRSRSEPPGFILLCQPALAERPPSGPGWLHQIKFDGYRVIARKHGEQVRLCARPRATIPRLSRRRSLVIKSLPKPCAL